MGPKSILGQHSYGISSDTTKAWITETGGHVGPVVFSLPSGEVQPFSVAPWAKESHDIPAILQVLRGDFFCAPFGSNDEPFGVEKHPLHGETANGNWSVDNHSDDSLSMTMRTNIRPGTVTKTVSVRPGQTAIYQRHTISDMKGPMCIGQHAMVSFASKGLISTSPFEFGQVFPSQFEDPAQGGYSSFRPGARFDNLERIPSNDGSLADLTRYPAREGFEDLAMVYAKRGSDFAWTAVSFPELGYVWFSLKDPRVLTGTVFWLSNGGRHYAPWSGRHRHVMGLEEVTSYFHYGLAGSVRENDASKEGLRTYFDLVEGQTLTVNSIIGVTPCASNAGKVENIKVVDGGISVEMASGARLSVRLDVRELYGE